MKEIVIVSACRTALGNFQGTLANIPAVELGAVVIKEAVKRAGIAPEQVDEVIMGNVLQAGLGQNPARQASVKAGLPVEVASYTLNKVCGSGLKAVALAFQAIQAGDAEVVVCGGMENMSLAPYTLPKARTGYRMGNGTLVDVMINDGLWDAFNNYHMGITAENVAAKFEVTREQQDEFAANSQAKAAAAIAAGNFVDEIVPVMIPSKKGDPVAFVVDEYPKATTAEKLGGLKPAFKKDGTVTAGNASGINDGAAAFVVMSADKAKELGVKPLAIVKASGAAGLDPTIMGFGPVASSQKALAKAGLTVADMSLIEANEAFAAQAIAVGRALEIPAEKLNVSGGAIALGHPIGSSGARILATLIYGLKRTGGKYGLATLCIGGGQGIALVIENVQ